MQNFEDIGAQARSVIEQLARHPDAWLQEHHAYGNDCPYLLCNANGAELQVNEARLLQEDLDALDKAGLVRREMTSKGSRKYTATRAAATQFGNQPTQPLIAFQTYRTLSVSLDGDVFTVSLTKRSDAPEHALFAVNGTASRKIRCFYSPQTAASWRSVSTSSWRKRFGPCLKRRFGKNEFTEATRPPQPLEHS